MYFTYILFFVTLFTGFSWLLEKIFFLPRRFKNAKKKLGFLHSDGSANLPLDGHFFSSKKNNYVEAEIQTERLDEFLRRPWWLECTAGFFPAIFFVFLLRSFVFEPFKIPSASMLPTLHIGDFILVNKFNYGVRLPIANYKLIRTGSPKRGDIVVFHYPLDKSVDYIKRVIGVPGDLILYKGKKLYINGLPVQTEKLKDFFNEQTARYVVQSQEKIGDRSYKVLRDNGVFFSHKPQVEFPFYQNCRFSIHEVLCKVPQEHYFVMGDNRDNSSDSRYWGFVPDKNIVGRAFFVWLNFAKISRIGKLH